MLAFALAERLCFILFIYLAFARTEMHIPAIVCMWGDGFRVRGVCEAIG